MLLITPLCKAPPSPLAPTLSPNRNRPKVAKSQFRLWRVPLPRPVCHVKHTHTHAHWLAQAAFAKAYDPRSINPSRAYTRCSFLISRECKNSGQTFERDAERVVAILTASKTSLLLSSVQVCVCAFVSVCFFALLLLHDRRSAVCAASRSAASSVALQGPLLLPATTVDPPPSLPF